jgi:hypothetical protein
MRPDLKPCVPRRLLLLAIVLSTAACGATSTTTPSAVTPATTTESFTGAVTHLATDGHSFKVSATGSVQISLTDVEPNAQPLTTMALGVSIGSWDGTTCGAAIAKNDNARSGATALSGTATAGDYCVQVYDSGNVPDTWSVSYTVQVAHP